MSSESTEEVMESKKLAWISNEFQVMDSKQKIRTSQAGRSDLPGRLDLKLTSPQRLRSIYR